MAELINLFLQLALGPLFSIFSLLQSLFGGTGGTG